MTIRFFLVLSQAVAFVMCMYAVHNGIAIGWFGAGGCALTATVLALQSDTEAT
jgi:hypothetical protein